MDSAQGNTSNLEGTVKGLESLFEFLLFTQDLSNACSDNANIPVVFPEVFLGKHENFLIVAKSPIAVSLLEIDLTNVKDGGSNIDAIALFETTNAKRLAVRVHRQVVISLLKVDTTNVVPGGSNINVKITQKGSGFRSTFWIYQDLVAASCVMRVAKQYSFQAAATRPAPIARKDSRQHRTSNSSCRDPQGRVLDMQGNTVGIVEQREMCSRPLAGWTHA
jgi:hypothetical protein